MFDKLFKKKNKVILYSPVKGNIVDLTEVPDPVFSGKMMGEGIAILPKDGVICSPINGQVTQVFETKHAILLKSIEGLEIMIHIGLDTVNLKGEGFEVLINEGEPINIGQSLVKVDLKLLKSKNINTITPIIILNHENKTIEKHLGDKIKKDIIMEVL